MPLRKNTTLHLLREGKPAVGTWLQLCSPHSARLLAAQGCFDWMLVDFEHTPLDNATGHHMLTCIADVSQGRTTPLARVIAGTMYHIKMALDCGAQGIIVPMINTAQEVRDVVRYSRYPPKGDRGAGALDTHLGYGVNRPEYIANANEEVLVGIQIETKEAIQNIEEILDVPGVDLFFIGPNDLHLSLGLPAKFWSDEPAFMDAVQKVIQGCKKRGIPCGTLCRDHPSAKARIADGFTFVGLGSDAHFMLTFAGMETGAMRGKSEPPETWCNMVQMSRL